MSNKKPFDEAKRERALKLLEESDPETAELVRGELEKRNKRKENPRPLGDETEDLLTIHPSFWMNPNFIRWQLLRRNNNYRSWADELFFNNYDFFNNRFPSLFKGYRPKEGQSILDWGSRVQRDTLKTLTDLDMQWEVTAKSVVWPKIPKSLPDRWLPIPFEISFPHPRLLSLLTASTVGLAVTTVPFESMKRIHLENRDLWVDLAYPWRTIREDIRSYDLFLEIETEEEMTQALFEARKQLEIPLRQRKRNSTPKRTRSRKRDSEPSRIARSLVAWDLRQDGKSYAQICKELWPEDVSRCSLRDIDGDPSSLLKRARDHVKDADQQIRSAVSF